MADIMVCFSCCVTQRPPQKRRRIDRTMIGLPTDFRHTGHIGSNDVDGEDSSTSNGHLKSIQTQMSSKGGYDESLPVHIERVCIDIQPDNS